MFKNKYLINNLFSVNKKVCIVTGAAGGIGKTISNLLEINGAIVIRIDILENSRQIENYFKVDITNINEIKKIINNIYKKYRRIDALLNVAGVSDPNNFTHNIDVNLTSVYELTNIIIEKMIKGKKGSVVNFTSLNAEMGFKNNPGYLSSKGGLKQLTKGFAMDYSNKKIRFNNVGPGYFKTNMTTKSYNNKLKRKERLNRILLKRFGYPEDLFGIIVYLISDASSYVTGQDFYIDGGFLAKGI
jgi:NAD(P)-dependent dehydrogenase (short-subunit alcohol dehydrogenase family)